MKKRYVMGEEKSNSEYDDVYACYDKNLDIRKHSSSGGVFFRLAECVIEQNGVVFAARFDSEWNVYHNYFTNMEDIEPFLKSKYVQSKMGDVYKKVFSFLNTGKLVLFCGTPCQIAGLKSYLSQGYDNLIAVDFICHGVPSPNVWKEYLNDVSQGRKIMGISFRDKTYGWENFSLKIEFENGEIYLAPEYDDLFLQGFLSDVYLRPSCYKCRFKGLERFSDITIGDFWGVKELYPDIYDEMGTSVLVVHSECGDKIWNSIKDNFMYRSILLQDVITTNRCYMYSVENRLNRYAFLKQDRICNRIKKYSKLTLVERIYRKGKRIIRKICKRGMGR